jgi:5-methylcytosine-specific restriction protein B
MVDDVIFEIRKEKAVAQGRIVPGGFLVLEGSTAMRDGAPSVKRNRPERDELVNQGVLVEDDDPDLYRFSRDHQFSSRSAAAGVVIDGNSNGDIWKAVGGAEVDRVGLVPLTRLQVEKAIDWYEALGEDGFNREYPQFGSPRDYWVRSTRPRAQGWFPSKPVVALAKGLPQLNGGWSTPDSAASLLHNSGFIIVDGDGKPVSVPTDKTFLLSYADRIRLCALNYYVEPARERNEETVEIRAGKLHDEIGLSQNWANVCQALGGKKFLGMSNLAAPVKRGPEAGSSTTFTYRLRPGESKKGEEETVAQGPTNQIFFGPPGTGKTYVTTEAAVRICDGVLPDTRAELLDRYEKLRESGQIQFVTFHQSYSYEDFVEGLRPTTSGDDAGPGFSLEVRHGIFRRISALAEQSRKAGNNADRIDLEGRQVFKMSLGRAGIDEHIYEAAIEGGYIILGWGGSHDWSAPQYANYNAIARKWAELGLEGGIGAIPQLWRFRSTMQIGDIVVVSEGNSRFRAIGEITGPYEYVEADDGEYNHRHDVRWLVVFDEPLPVETIYQDGFTPKSCYKLVDQKLKLEALARLIPGQEGGEATPDSFVLIIDEINRANISKVFGELITLLEPDKRLGAENEIRLTLPYSGDTFGVPSNLHIIGTMNTADRSIALLDTALRRRFTFRELMPEPSLLEPVGVKCGIDLEGFLTAVNSRIEYLFDREHQVGHAFFMGCKSRADVDAVMRDKVIPLLSEYFYEDRSKVALVLGDEGKGDRFLHRSVLNAPAADSEEWGEPRESWRVLDAFGVAAYDIAG